MADQEKPTPSGGEGGGAPKRPLQAAKLQAASKKPAATQAAAKLPRLPKKARRPHLFPLNPL